MPPPTLRDLVVGDLGYCCLEYFLRRYPSTTTVATRLGVTTSTVKAWRRRVRAGEDRCTGCEKCLQRRAPLP